jgi:hypothetical protein
VSGLCSTLAGRPALSQALHFGTRRMDSLRDLHWSPTEKKAAHKAFDLAYERECRAISSELKQMMADNSDPHNGETRRKAEGFFG